MAQKSYTNTVIALGCKSIAGSLRTRTMYRYIGCEIIGSTLVEAPGISRRA
jgi:hypothetical protein